MKPKSVCAVYFSATDTTKTIVSYIANVISEKFSIPVKIIDFTPKTARELTYEFGEDDMVVFGTPVYAGRVPNVIIPFIRSGFVGHDTMAVPVVLYGNRNYDDALIELRNILEDNGFRTIAAGAFIGEHSFSRTLAAGRPDASDMRRAHELAQTAIERAESFSADSHIPIWVRGETPIRPYYTPRDRAGNPVNILKVKPKTDMELCDRCGICAEVCPMSSIDREAPEVVAGICIKCGACTKKCPRGAKYYDDDKYLYHQHELEEGFSRRAEPELF